MNLLYCIINEVIMNGIYLIFVGTLLNFNSNAQNYSK